MTVPSECSAIGIDHHYLANERNTLQKQNGVVATSSIIQGAASDAWTYSVRDVNKQSQIDEVLAAVPTKFLSFAGFPRDAASKDVSSGDGRHSIELVMPVYQAVRSQVVFMRPYGPDTQCYDGWLPTPKIKGT